VHSTTESAPNSAAREARGLPRREANAGLQKIIKSTNSKNSKTYSPIAGHSFPLRPTSTVYGEKLFGWPLRKQQGPRPPGLQGRKIGYDFPEIPAPGSTLSRPKPRSAPFRPSRVSMNSEARNLRGRGVTSRRQSTNRRRARFSNILGFFTSNAIRSANYPPTLFFQKSGKISFSTNFGGFSGIFRGLWGISVSRVPLPPTGSRRFLLTQSTGNAIFSYF